MPRKTYTPVKQEDGSFKIEAVEIFKLGESKGRNFDQKWFARAVAKHNRFKEESEYLPSVMVGHKGWLQEHEKPELCCFDNLRLAEDNTTVLCDYLVEDASAFGVFNTYPHRSVEIFVDEAHISRVAHLGGTEPYFKMKPLKVEIASLFQTNEEPETFNFDDGQEPLQFTADPEVGADGDPPADPDVILNEVKDPSASTTELEQFRAERDAALEKQKNLETELAAFRAQAQANALKSETELLEQRKKHRQNSGIAKPVIDLYFDLRKALLFADNPLDCTVKLDNNGTPVEKTFAQALDDFENLLFKHATDQTLVVKLDGHNLPFQEHEPQLHAEVESAEQEQAKQVAAIKQYFADKGQTQWTNEEYKLARVELGFLKP